MRKWGSGSFWLMVAVSGAAYPFLYRLVIGLIYLVKTAVFDQWHIGYALVVVAALPFYAIATGWIFVPVGMLFGAIAALVSRKTATPGLWILRGALTGSLLGVFSYLPLVLRLHDAWWWSWIWPLTIVSGAVAGAGIAWFMVRWRPLAVDHPEAAMHAIAGASPSANRGTLLGLTFAFSIIGPLLGALIVVLVFSLAEGANRPNSIRFATQLIGAIPVIVLLAPLGFVSALITGFFSGLVSRGTLSTWRWLAYTAVLGGGLSAVSIQTVMVILIYGSNRGMWNALAYSLGGMFVLGAVSALACGWICRGFRPRALLAQSS